MPHNISCDEDGWVFVADRENHRVQVFNGDGKYECEWHNLHRPSALYIPPGRCPYCYIGECGPVMSINRRATNLGPRLSIVTKEGKVVARLGDRTPENFPGPFTSPHGIAVNSRGDIYVGEVSRTAWGNLFPGETLAHSATVSAKVSQNPLEHDGSVCFGSTARCGGVFARHAANTNSCKVVKSASPCRRARCGRNRI